MFRSAFMRASSLRVHSDNSVATDGVVPAGDGPASRADVPPPRGALRVLHVEAGRHVHGGARQVLYLLEGLRAHGVDSVLACAAGSDVERAARGQGERVLPLPMRGDLDPLLAWRLATIMRAERPDLVHLHSRRGADVHGVLAARVIGIPIVISRRVDRPPTPVIGRWAFTRSACVVAISQRIARTLASAGVRPEKIACVPSAVDPAPYAQPAPRAHLVRACGLRDDDVVVAVVAQLAEHKGHRYLLEALPAIVAAVPRVRCVFFGRGSLGPALLAQAAALGVAERVVLAGFRTDLPALLGAVDAVVHPATSEGLGVALLEAAAAARPIVASAVGGIPEIVEDGRTGFLVPPRDPAALARAVVRVLTDAALARRLGDAARAHVTERHSVAAMVAGNLAVYAGVLG
jgi:glycosyltransferase involved in cell wall biosynthesis